MVVLGSFKCGRKAGKEQKAAELSGNKVSALIFSQILDSLFVYHRHDICISINYEY